MKIKITIETEIEFECIDWKDAPQIPDEKFGEYPMFIKARLFELGSMHGIADQIYAEKMGWA